MTDERDPKVTQRYRRLGGEEPPRELDQSILAAAHRAADRPHAPLVTPAGRHRWYFALGAAAVLVLAVAVTVQVERQQPDPEVVAMPQAASPSPQQQPEDAQRAEAPKPVERRKAPSTPAAKPEGAAREERLDSSADLRRSRVAAARLAESPERFLERIAELRKEGRHDEADKALAEFRQRYPDYRIAQEMLQKVERKK